MRPWLLKGNHVGPPLVDNASQHVTGLLYAPLPIPPYRAISLVRVTQLW